MTSPTYCSGGANADTTGKRRRNRIKKRNNKNKMIQKIE